MRLRVNRLVPLALLAHIVRRRHLIRHLALLVRLVLQDRQAAQIVLQDLHVLRHHRQAEFCAPAAIIRWVILKAVHCVQLVSIVQQ